MKTNEQTLISRVVLRAFAVALGTYIVASSAYATVIISDGTFNPSDWAVNVTVSTGGATQTAQQNLSGGNPGAYRYMTHPLPLGPSSIGVAHLFQPASYTPSTQGAIISMDYSEDHIQFNPSIIGARPLLMQGNTLFIGPSINFTDLAWTTVSLTGLTAAAFSNGSSHPDFSALGTTIQFGYGRSNTNNPGDPPLTTQHGIDNWSFTIHNAVQGVPDSGGLSLPLLGLLGIITFGHYSRKKFARTE